MTAAGRLSAGEMTSQEMSGHNWFANESDIFARRRWLVGLNVAPRRSLLQITAPCGKATPASNHAIDRFRSFKKITAGVEYADWTK